MSGIGFIKPELAARALELAMSEISERCYCAGWMSGLEVSLWEMVHHPDQRGYGMCTKEDVDTELLGALSDAAGGWVTWRDVPWTDDRGVEHPTGPASGARFLTFSEWQEETD